MREFGCWFGKNPEGVPGPRAGFTLLEALVVILLTAMVVQGGWAVFATFRRAGGKAGDEAEGLETARTVAWILGEELSGSVPQRDWWTGGGDSVSLRAYRGLVFVEGSAPGGEIRVCYRGIRSPNPAKDSVLFLGERGIWSAYALRSRARGDPGCMGAGKGWEELWTVEPEWSGEVLGRLFERGSYHLTGGALRYRRGGGGRQPLTPLRIAEGTLEPGGGTEGGLRWVLHLSLPGGGADALPWSGWVR